MIFSLIPLFLLLSSCDPPSTDVNTPKNLIQNKSEIRKCDPYLLLSETCKEEDGNVMINGKCFQGLLSIGLDSTLTLGGVGTDEQIYSAQLYQDRQNIKIAKPYLKSIEDDEAHTLELPSHYAKDSMKPYDPFANAFQFTNVYGKGTCYKNHRRLFTDKSSEYIKITSYTNKSLLKYDCDVSRIKYGYMLKYDTPEPIPTFPKGDLALEVFGLKVDPKTLEEPNDHICDQIGLKLMHEFPGIVYINDGQFLRNKDGTITKKFGSGIGFETYPNCRFRIIMIDRIQPNKELKPKDIPRMRDLEITWRSTDNGMILENICMKI